MSADMQSPIVQLFDSRLPTRFWDKVATEPNSGCWLWFGAISDTGYGTINMWSNGRSHYHGVHRLVMKVSGMVHASEDVVDHLCRTRSCCNPMHLEVVDTRTNTLRGESPTAEHARKTHCINGHELTSENTYATTTVLGRRGRSCIRCYRARAAKSKAKYRRGR